MDINVLNSKWLSLALLALCVVSGCCCQAVPLPGENQCPTDARRLYFSCGEEAVRRCPCGPDHEYYGLKPTCWRAWPEGWHCNQCEGSACDGMSCAAGTCAQPVVETPAPAVEIDTTNPFRSKAGVDELPQPPITPEIAPAKTEPPKSAPIHLPPIQQTPTPTPTTEKAPLDFLPVIDVPVESPPAAKTPALDKLTEPVPNPVVTPPQTPPIVPPAASEPVPNPVATPPQTLPIVPPAASSTPVPTTAPPIPPYPVPSADTPVTTPPNESVPKTSAPKLNSPPEPPATPPKDAKTHANTAKPKNDESADPAVSNRVEQHLINNLRM